MMLMYKFFSFTPRAELFITGPFVPVYFSRTFVPVFDSFCGACFGKEKETKRDEPGGIDPHPPAPGNSVVHRCYSIEKR